MPRIVFAPAIQRHVAMPALDVGAATVASEAKFWSKRSPGSSASAQLSFSASKIARQRVPRSSARRICAFSRGSEESEMCIRDSG